MTAAPDSYLDALRDVYDPCCQEKGISVVDMGLVRSIDVEARRATVELLLTTGWCPFAVRVVDDVRERIAALEEIDEAHVEVVWDEPWTTDRLSASARQKLRFLPDPVAVADPQSYVAEHRLRPQPPQAPSPTSAEESGHDR
jgi:metal-sulfur cluster biosynthetic enzyme